MEGGRPPYFDNCGNNRYPVNGACLFRPALAGEGELARKFCLLGATNDDLAGCFEVARRTFDDWIATIPDVANGVKQGRDIADAAVVQNYPPDTQACMFWLRNRQRRHWLEKAPAGAGRRRRGMAERTRRRRRAGAPCRKRVMQGPRDLTVTTFTRRSCYS